jgi:WD40 repeat protein
MVLPIAATTGLLWLLLLYLLKDAELLEAQQDHVDSDPSDEKSIKPLQGQMSFSTLPRSFSSDVELIASSRDGQVIVSVGLHNEITVWNLATRTHMSIDATNLLLRTASSSHASPTLTSVAVEENGEYFAVGTGSGMVAVWRIDKSSIKSLIHLSLENSSAGVTGLQFGNLMPRLDLNHHAAASSLHPNLPNSEVEDLVVLLATFENGVAAKWTINEFATLSYVKPIQNAIITNVLFARVAPENQVLIAFAFDDGSLELVETGDTLPIILPNYHVRPGSRSDLVSHVHACRSELNGTKRLVVATATESGIVSVWDGSTGECISVLEEAAGRVTHLRVSPIRSETCHYCGQLPLESVSIAFSIDYIVRFFLLCLKDQTRRCSCTRKQPLKHVSSSDHLGLRSRSNSGTSSQMGSPRIPRARLATAFETPAFPVSGHGVQFRRVSEKESGRRSSELLNISTSSEDHDLLSPLDGTSTPMQSPISFWRNAVAILVTETTCERGGWDVLGREYVGIRRRPRTQGKMRGEMKMSGRCRNSVLGLTSATLERWEVWTFDPVVSQMRSSVLVALVLKPPPEGESIPSSPTSSTTSSVESVSRLPFTRVTSLHVASSSVFAGFGNTIGVMRYKTDL